MLLVVKDDFHILKFHITNHNVFLMWTMCAQYTQYHVDHCTLTYNASYTSYTSHQYINVSDARAQYNIYYKKQGLGCLYCAHSVAYLSDTWLTFEALDERAAAAAA